MLRPFAAFRIGGSQRPFYLPLAEREFDAKNLQLRQIKSVSGCLRDRWHRLKAVACRGDL